MGHGRFFFPALFLLTVLLHLGTCQTDAVGTTPDSANSGNATAAGNGTEKADRDDDFSFDVLDVVAVFGDSARLKRFDFKQIKETVRRLARGLQLRYQGNRLGAILSEPHRLQVVRPTDNSTALMKDLAGFQKPNKMALTTHALNRMATMIRSQGRFRTSHVGVVINAGPCTNTTDLLAEARRAKKAGMVLFAVAVGKKADVDTLKHISSFGAVIAASSFKNLRVKVIRPLAKRILKSAPEWNRLRYKRADTEPNEPPMEGP